MQKFLAILIQIVFFLFFFGSIALASDMTVDGFDFPLGKPNGTGYEGGDVGLDFLETHDYASDSYPEYHPGEDWNDDNSGNDWGGNSNDAGDPIYAVADGFVDYADYYSSDWGRIVMIEHNLASGSSNWSQSGHMATISQNPRTLQQWAPGDIVYRGEQIGTVGPNPSGCSCNYHLHFEIRKKDQLAYAFPNNTFYSGGDYQPWSSLEVQRYYNNPSDYINNNRPPTYINISGTINSNSTWKPNRVYAIDGSVTLAASASLHVQPGAIVKFKTDSSSLTVNGELAVSGTSASRSYFTSYKDDTVGGDTNGNGSADSPNSDDWDQIQFTSGSSSSLDYSTIRFGGDGYGIYSDIYMTGGTLNVSNSTISSSSYYGAYIAGGSTDISGSTIKDNIKGVGAYGTGTLVLNNNTFTDNSYYPAEFGYSNGGTVDASGNTSSGTGKHGYSVTGSMVADQTWSNDLPYIVDYHGLTVNSGKTLTLEPGAIVKFDPDSSNSSNLTVDGNLVANGTSGNKIYFTSLKDDSVGGDTNNDNGSTAPDAGNWRHIKFNSDSTASISHSVIRFGGNYTGGSYSNLYITGGIVNMSYSTIASSYYYGIFESGGTSSISNSAIYDNYYGFYNSTATVSANNNWWGDASGPHNDSSNPSGTGNGVSNFVDFIPWLPSWP